MDIPAFAGTVSLRYSRPVPSATPSATPAAPLADARRRNQLTIAAVAFLLGLLVVVQLRAQAGSTGLAALSAQDLTVLVANLNERNDQLRREVASLERELGTLTANQSRGDASIDEIRTDLRRVRAYAGLDPVAGPGVTITISGPIDGAGLEDLINELRNGRRGGDRRRPVRLVPGLVVDGGPARPRSTASRSARRSSWSAIGASEQLTGSLTRSGGVIAQLAATQPDVVCRVTPMDRLELPGDRPGPPARSTVNPGFDTLTRPMTEREVLQLYLGDVVRLRRTHPCGVDTWLVDRLGADIGLRCQGCGRHVLLERRALERRIAGFVERGDPALSAALTPPGSGPTA